MHTNDELRKQIEIMKNYLLMNIQREDWHSVWDGAIDLQRLSDKLERLNDASKSNS